MADDRNQNRQEEELSVEELEDAAGGVPGANTNCSLSCPTNVNCATSCLPNDN